jgi:N-acetylmuramoyl-L-alanine amidase
MIITSCRRAVIATMALLVSTCPFVASNAADTNQNRDVTVISLGNYSVSYISLVELADRFNLQLRYDPIMLKTTTLRGSKSITVVDRSTTATYNGTAVNLVYPVRLIQGAMFVPAQTFIPLFANLVPGIISWDDHKKQINTQGVRYSIESIRFEPREGGLLATISTAEPLTCEDELTGDGWLTLRFAGATYDPSLFSGITDESAGFITEINHQQREGETVIAFKVTETMGSYSISRSMDPPALLLSLRNRSGEGSVSGNDTFTDGLDEGDPYALDAPVPFVNRNDELIVIDTIIIDAGHGDQDPGAIGPKGTKEKDVVLAIAKELKRIIDERKEIRAVLTRDRDILVPLQDRAKIASKADGKLFLSIHANALTDRRVAGMEAYFLSDAKTEGAKLVAERENAVVKFEDNPGLYGEENDLVKKIQFDMMSNVYIDESHYLCQLLLDKGVKATKQQSRGVRQGPFYVLLGTQALMPSVLFEVGYISNAEEEKMLTRVSYQKRVAEAMYDAIIEFKRRAERDIAEKRQ